MNVLHRSVEVTSGYRTFGLVAGAGLLENVHLYAEPFPLVA